MIRGEDGLQNENGVCKDGELDDGNEEKIVSDK